MFRIFEISDSKNPVFNRLPEPSHLKFDKMIGFLGGGALGGPIQTQMALCASISLKICLSSIISSNFAQINEG